MIRLFVRVDELEKNIGTLQAALSATTERLAEIQAGMFRQSKAYLDSHMAEASSLDDLVRKLEQVKGFVRVGWCETQRCEDTIREKTGASPRVIPLDAKASGACVVCGKPAKVYVSYARAY